MLLTSFSAKTNQMKIFFTGSPTDGNITEETIREDYLFAVTMRMHTISLIV
jgi:hypothetical protein